MVTPDSQGIWVISQAVDRYTVIRIKYLYFIRLMITTLMRPERPWRLVLLMALLALAACSSINPHYDAAKSHHRPDGFANSDPQAVSAGQFPWYEILWRRLRGDFQPQQEPEGGYAAFIAQWRVAPDLEQIRRRTDAPRLTWLGHAGLLLQVANLNILIDPHLTDIAGPDLWLFQPGARRHVPPPLTPEELPPIDVVLISHNHYDHLDEATLLRLEASGQRPRYFVPLGLKRWFIDRNIDRVTEMDWWDRLSVSGIALHFTPSQHWSKRTPVDANRSLWGGFMVETASPAWRFLYSGDTGYSSDFKEIRHRLGSVDFLTVPVGAYLPRDFMRPQHVNPDDALQIMLDLDARQTLGVHWGTFELTQESFDHPPRDLAAALAARGLLPERVWMLKHGETRALSSR